MAVDNAGERGSGRDEEVFQTSVGAWTERKEDKPAPVPP